MLSASHSYPPRGMVVFSKALRNYRQTRHRRATIIQKMTPPAPPNSLQQAGGCRAVFCDPQLNPPSEVISISAPSCCTRWNLAKEGWAVRGLFPHVLPYMRACQTQFTNGAEVSPKANKVRARPPWIYHLPPCNAWRVYGFSERPEFKLAPLNSLNLTNV